MEKIDIKFAKGLDYNATEAFKRLRTNIDLNDKQRKVIAITSSIPKEGKTSVAFNLAGFMAKINKKVLFVDGDLRKSNFSRLYGVSTKEANLGDYLLGQKELKDIIYPTTIDNLDLILSNKSYDNSPELLDSSHFKTMVSDLKKDYDYIFIDTPSLANVIDGALVVKECDGVILVIEEDAVSRKLARRVVEQLELTGCEILGVVLNKAKHFKDEVPQDNYYIK